MIKLTPNEAEELRQIMTGIQNGNWNAASKRRAFDLLQREVSARLAADMPRILDRARMQHNAQRVSRQAAMDAGRRAGIEAGRRFIQEQRNRRKW